MKKLLFLAFLPIFGLLLSNNCFATKHDYNALFTGDLITPPIQLDSSTGLYHYNFDLRSDSPTTNYGTANSHSNSMLFVYPSSFNESFVPYKYNYHYDFFASVYPSDFTRSGDNCFVNPPNSNIYPVRSDFYAYTDDNHYKVRFRTQQYPVSGLNYFVSSSGSILNADCYKINARDHGITYSYNTIGQDWRHITGDFSRVYPSPPAGYELNNIATANGLTLSNEQRTSSGVIYSANFSLSRYIKNSNGSGFQAMYLPLSTLDGYFLKSENIPMGREFEWHFNFFFNGGITWNPDLSTVSAYIDLQHARKASDHSPVTVPHFPCTVDTINSSIDGVTVSNVDFTCPVTLDDYYTGFMPQFVLINSADSYVFTTNDEWSFSGVYVVSDGDWSQGDSFNTEVTNGGWSAFNGSGYEDSLDPDWLTSLKNLFNFSLSNTPLGLIFGSFDNNNCVQIPIIAGMIHSNETQVCPWFSAETRSITTPVLALFSGFLIFGFFMRWLGSSSGNFVEDSSIHESGNFTIKKRGK